MADLEERFVNHVEALEQIVEEAADGKSPEVAARLRERLDAAMPALDDLQDELGDLHESEHESDEHE